MEFVKFKLPTEIGKLLGTECFMSYIITNHDGFKIAFYRPDDAYDVVFDFRYTVEDYRISPEGRRLEHHTQGNLPEPWLFIEVKDSEYLKKLDKESQGLLLAINPNLKHYMLGDVDYCIDIVSIAEPEVYKAKKIYQEKLERLPCDVGKTS